LGERGRCVTGRKPSNMRRRHAARLRVCGEGRWGFDCETELVDGIERWGWAWGYQEWGGKATPALSRGGWGVWL